MLICAWVLFVVHFCSSCTTRQTALQIKIEAIHNLADSDPDSAYRAISGISAKDLHTDGLKAHYALTYSKILDKNRIDICNDSIIYPAVAYFSRRGNPQKKLETFYYAGRVYENCKRFEDAISMLLKAEENIEDDSWRTAALVYSSKARIYCNSLDFAKAAENYRKAAVSYGIQGNTDRYVSNRLREADCLMGAGEVESASEVLTEVRPHLENISKAASAKYYQLAVSIAETRSSEEAGKLIGRFRDALGKTPHMDWLLAARIYIHDNEISLAEEALMMHAESHRKDGTYHYHMARVQEMKGCYAKATESYKEYIRLESDKGKDILSQETRFIEERQMHLNKYEKEKNRKIMLTLIIAVIFLVLSLTVAVILSISRELKLKTLERDSLSRQLDGLMQEREELAEIERDNREGREIIRERLRIIDQFVMSDAFNDGVFEDKASRTLKKILSDRSEFVRQNRLIFNQSAGSFIAFLKDRGLTDIEIDHCCLYAIGMNGKMVTAFTNIKRHYHIGSDVRKKLGLSGHDTNISIYIRKLYKELESHRPEA